MKVCSISIKKVPGSSCQLRSDYFANSKREIVGAGVAKTYVRSECCRNRRCVAVQVDARELCARLSGRAVGQPSTPLLVSCSQISMSVVSYEATNV